MTLLVTGGAGFIGSNFIRYILKRYPKYKIINLDKLTYAGNLENLADIKNNPHYQFVRGDISDGKIVDRVMSRSQIVVHFAAESHVDRSILNPAPFIQTNIVGTQVLLNAALKYKIKRFHHISTDEVFGMIPLKSKKKWYESSPYQPRSPYASSKAAADHLVRAYYVTYGLPITITNCSNNFGPYQFPEKFIPLAITNLLEAKRVPVYRPGNQVRDWLYVSDHCRAIVLVLHYGKAGETYLVGGESKEISNLEVAEKILKLLHKNLNYIEMVKDRPGHDVKYALNWSKIKKELGFKPEYSLEEGLVKTVEWYKKNQRWWKRIKSGEYLKYYQKQYGGHC